MIEGAMDLEGQNAVRLICALLIVGMAQEHFPLVAFKSFD